MGIHPIRFLVMCVLITGCIALMGGAAMAVSAGRTIWYIGGSGTGIMSSTASSFTDGMTDAKAENDKQAKARAKAHKKP
jgi:ABC-type uncharacterized transport system permease subunit